MGLNAGDLDREIVFQVATRVRNPNTGAVFIVWVPEPEATWAEWVPGGTKETWKDPRLMATIDGVFKIYDRTPRPSPDTYRIAWNGQVFDISGVIEIERGQGLILPVAARAETT